VGPPASRRFPRRTRLSACHRRVAATRPRRSRALRALSELRADVSAAASQPRLASHAPTAPSPTASPRAPPAAAVRSRPRVFERADVAVYTVRAPVSAPAPPRFSRLPSALILSTLVLVGRRRTAVPPDAGVHASSCHSMPPSTPRVVPRRRPRAGEPPPSFPRPPPARR
jgi:hypothetical protein